MLRRKKNRALSIHSIVVSQENFLMLQDYSLYDIRCFFCQFDMGGLSGKQTSGTFMSSNDLVTHQTHKNG